MALPDFLVIGAPKAGSTAVHAALERHPQLFLSTPKEPKYFLTPDERPRRSAHRGPGDAHSAQEWVWRREHYEKLFEHAPSGALRGESTPFYLWDTTAHLRIRDTVPHAKLIAIVRDPVDRAYSNWTHLRSDGLEPESDFRTACLMEPQRIAAGFAPFWRYLDLGRYGEQLAHLFDVFPQEQVHVLRYRELIDEPRRTLDSIFAFLGVATGVVTKIPPSNLSGWAGEGALNAALRRTIRTGAALGSYLPPKIWRHGQRPLVAALRRQRAHRPGLPVARRRELVELFRDDIGLLEGLLGRSFQDWLGDTGRGTYAVRNSWAPSARDASQ
ncbi:MAG TPA: sulfotransferase [Jatrophihabitantaceae bacterium]